MTYRLVKDTECVSPFFVIESAHVNPSRHLLEVIDPLSVVILILTAIECTHSFWRFKVYFIIADKQRKCTVCACDMLPWVITKLALNVGMIKKESINVLLVRGQIALSVWAL